MLVLSLIEEVGIKRVVLLSMMGADRFINSSRAAAKLAAEQVIWQRGIPATILRPNAVFQNDLPQGRQIVDHHTYSTPLGSIGLTLVDIRDVAEVAAMELIRRETSSETLPTEMIEIVGPEIFTGQKMARLWSEVTGHTVTYTGDDLDGVEQAMRRVMPADSAYDLIIVFRGILQEGGIGAKGASDHIARLLGRPLRSYRLFAETVVAT
ncbi:hypothetical protein CBS101457_004844 [Exobasidium rhododendri]|nr:hypothetical protein CBS101457_004844 [Exobasidium rhododendri]